MAFLLVTIWFASELFVSGQLAVFGESRVLKALPVSQAELGAIELQFCQ
ncbi:hypothetical protein VCR31J2_1310820 [Vibrio coralliirubri]|uniref:Uncharacterized protein n=1 Tax=Vibrio coralliirubri TaxID=1516159 RepID=A0AA86X013_9VIBR|nr:hypothetical protein VCR31J2_1310820 [Vibrio coralliirubri]